MICILKKDSVGHSLIIIAHNMTISYFFLILCERRGDNSTYHVILEGSPNLVMKCDEERRERIKNIEFRVTQL